MVEIIKFYGCYFIADANEDFYLMVDTHNNKVVRVIDKDCYQMIALLSEIKNEVRGL